MDDRVAVNSMRRTIESTSYSWNAIVLFAVMSGYERDRPSNKGDFQITSGERYGHKGDRLIPEAAVFA